MWLIKIPKAKGKGTFRKKKNNSMWGDNNVVNKDPKGKRKRHI